MTGTIARSAVINLRVRFLRARNRIGRQEPRSRGGYYVARFAVPIFFLASPPRPRVADSQFRRVAMGPVFATSRFTVSSFFSTTRRCRLIRLGGRLAFTPFRLGD